MRLNMDQVGRALDQTEIKINSEGIADVTSVLYYRNAQESDQLLSEGWLCTEIWGL